VGNIIRGCLVLAMLTELVVVCPPGALAADTDKPVVKVKPKPIPEIPFFTFIDDRLTYSYVFNVADAGFFTPKAGGGYNGTGDEQVLAFTHFDTWEYGTNFLNVGLYKTGHDEGANPCGGTLPIGNCAGHTDIYGQIRSTLGFNQIFDTHAFSWGPLHNVSLEVGGDADASNSYLASAVLKGFAGLQFAFDLPYKGFLNIAPLYKTEQAHNSFTQCGDIFASPAPACNFDGVEHYNDTWAVEVNYSMDLGFLPETIQYFNISGRVGIYGPKGPTYGIAGNEPTKTEINSEPVRITFDAGKAIWGKKYTHEVDYWVAYRYWKNEFGYNDQSAPFVCTQFGVSTNSCTASYYATGITVKF
jgi:hypothetical protein